MSKLQGKGSYVIHFYNEGLLPFKIQGCCLEQCHGDFSSRQGSCMVWYFEKGPRESWTGTYFNMECFQRVISSTICPWQLLTRHVPRVVWTKKFVGYPYQVKVWWAHCLFSQLGWEWQYWTFYSQLKRIQPSSKLVFIVQRLLMKLMVWLERDVNNFMERNKGQLKKRFLKFNYHSNQSSKFAKFSKTSKPSQILKFNKGNKFMMMSKEDQEEHIKKVLCFKYQIQSFECSTFKRRTTTLEVEQEDDDEFDGKSSRVEVLSISVAIISMEVEQEPTMLQIKGFSLKLKLKTNDLAL